MENHFETTLENAKSLFQKGSFDASRQQFVTLLNANYEPVTCHYYLGLINLNLKNYDDAVRDFSICAKSDPSNVNYSYYLGTVAELQDNSDLALNYYHKTLKLKPDHTNALNAIKRLKIAGEDREPDTTYYRYPDEVHGNSWRASHGNDSHPRVSDVHLPDNSQFSSDNNGQFAPHDLYDTLKEASDKQSKIAVQMIDAMRMVNKRPRYSAYFGRIFWGIILPIWAWSAYVISKDVYPYGSAFQKIIAVPLTINSSPIRILFLLLVVFAVLRMLYTIIKINTTRVTIDRAFFELKTGIFSTDEPVYYVHKLEFPDIHRSFMNLITGDGTFIISVEEAGGKTKQLKIRGLDSIKNMRELKMRLQNVRLQLRNTEVIKSGIYG